MLHPYDECDLSIVQDKLGTLFEIAVLVERHDIDEFAEIFLKSKISKRIEEASPIYLLGKSATELYALIMNEEPKDYDLNDYGTPEYWALWALAYVSWHLNKPFEELIHAYPLSKFIMNYFPYHEMDISKCVDLFIEKLDMTTELAKRRKMKNYSQKDLSLLSGVPVRVIQSYEQRKIDITDAKVSTLYKLSKALGCTIEELIL